MEVRMATIEYYMLSFYFAFYYSKQPYFYKDRILRMAKFLNSTWEQKNRLEQRWSFKEIQYELLREDSTTIESIRARKSRQVSRTERPAQ